MLRNPRSSAAAWSGVAPAFPWSTRGPGGSRGWVRCAHTAMLSELPWAHSVEQRQAVTVQDIEMVGTTRNSQLGEGKHTVTPAVPSSGAAAVLVQ